MSATPHCTSDDAKDLDHSLSLVPPIEWSSSLQNKTKQTLHRAPRFSCLLGFPFCFITIFSNQLLNSPNQQPTPCSYHAIKSPSFYQAAYYSCSFIPTIPKSDLTNRVSDPSTYGSSAGLAHLPEPPICFILDLLTCLWPPAKNFIKAENLFLHKLLIYYYADWVSECSKVRKSRTQS